LVAEALHDEQPFAPAIAQNRFDPIRVSSFSLLFSNSHLCVVKLALMVPIVPLCNRDFRIEQQGIQRIISP